MEARVPQSEIPAVYDALSKTYDIWGKLAETKARNRVFELADVHDGQNILEVTEIIWRVPGRPAIRKITAKWISSNNPRIPSAAAISLRSHPGFKNVKKEWALEVPETFSAHFKYVKIWSI